MNLCDAKTVKNIMTAYGLHFRKEFGQNFLTNKMVVEDIADNCTDTADGTILEIGPGIGTLTREGPNAGANLKNRAISRIGAIVGNILHHHFVGEKVLAELLSEMKPVCRHNVFYSFCIT